jgi:hypothetical protein
MHARVDDAILPRTGKDCGIGKFPSASLAMNKAWLTATLTAATLLAWLKLLALDGAVALAEPKTLRPNPARCCPPDPRRASADYASRPPGPGPLTSWLRGTSSAPCPKLPDQHEAAPAIREGASGPWNPRPFGPPAGPRS